MDLPSTVASLAVMLAMGVLAIEVASAVVLFPDLLGALKGTDTLTVFILTPFYFTLFEIGHELIPVVYIVELIIVVACIAYTLYSTWRTYKDSGDDPASLKGSAAFEAIWLFGIVTLLEIVYILVATSALTETDTSILENVASIYKLMNASVYEELLCRVLLIGLPVALIVMLRKERDLPFYRYLLGGFGFRGWMLPIVLISATFFAIGHTEGWGLWKIVPTFSMALVMGYLFVKHGVHTTILIHFLTDFMIGPIFISQVMGGLIGLVNILVVGGLSMLMLPMYYRKVRDMIKGLIPKGEQ